MKYILILILIICSSQIIIRPQFKNPEIRIYGESKQVALLTSDSVWHITDTMATIKILFEQTQRLQNELDSFRAVNLFMKNIYIELKNRDKIIW